MNRWPFPVFSLEYSLFYSRFELWGHDFDHPPSGVNRVKENYWMGNWLIDWKIIEWEIDWLIGSLANLGLYVLKALLCVSLLSIWPLKTEGNVRQSNTTYHEGQTKVRYFGRLEGMRAIRQIQFPYPCLETFAMSFVFHQFPLRPLSAYQAS